MRSDLPPRLRDWKKGTPQIGAFIRTRNGGTISIVNDAANEAQEALVFALVLGATKMPPELLRDLKAWVNSHVKREEV